MARIVTVYSSASDPWDPQEMGKIRWLKISEALARRGHQVDMASNEAGLAERGPVTMAPGLRRIPLSRIPWSQYDAVKTLFHRGFQTLEDFGGRSHPFLISKLGSVVGETDLPDVYFYGEMRERLYAVQKRIAERGGIVTLLTAESTALWRRCHGERNRLLLVPGATEEHAPTPGLDPYPAPDRPRCLYSGNIYFPASQPEAHHALVKRLNRLGELLATRGIRLYVNGAGDTSGLNPNYVTHLGAASYQHSWDYLWHADIGMFSPSAPR